MLFSSFIVTHLYLFNSAMFGEGVGYVVESGNEVVQDIAMNGKHEEPQLMRTTFRGVRANLPAHRDAARLSRERGSCFYSCSGCFQF